MCLGWKADYQLTSQSVSLPILMYELCVVMEIIRSQIQHMKKSQLSWFGRLFGTGRRPQEDPEHARGITCLVWPGSALVYIRRKWRVSLGRRTSGLPLLSLVPTQDGWMNDWMDPVC